MFMENSKRHLRRRHWQLLLLVLFVAMFSPGPLLAQNWHWTVEDLDEKNPEQTSIIADKDGNVHLAYYLPEGFGELRYAFRSAANSRWFKLTLDVHLGVFSTGITLDANENPAVCYTPRQTKYAHWDGQKWSSQAIDANTGVVAYHCSIRFAAGGGPHMTWYLEGSFTLRHAFLQDAVWKVRSVDVGNQSGKWNSLVVDDKGFPYVAYSSWRRNESELGYAYFNGKGWLRTVVDTSEGDPHPGSRGMGASLVFNRDGDPRISYYDLNALKYARLVRGKWVIEVIEQLPTFNAWSWKNFQSNQILDRDGNPHISYESFLGLKHAWWDGKQWHTQLIKPYVVGFFFESSMTMDNEGNLYISFKDPSDGTLRVAIGRRSTLPETAKTVTKNESN